MADKLKLEYRNPKELLKYEFNNKIHPKEQIKEISKSIQEYGFNVPVIIDKDSVIIAGHGRVEASKELWLKEIPVVVKNNLTDEQVRKYRLLDNKTAELGDLDIENITKELEEIWDKALSDLFDIAIDSPVTDEEMAEFDIDDIDLPDVEENTVRGILVPVSQEKYQETYDEFQKALKNGVEVWDLLLDLLKNANDNA